MNGQVFGEFFGTMVLIAFGDGVVACALLEKSKGQNAGWVHINWGWAFAVMLGVFAAIATGAPQADINPAVTLAKALNGVYTGSQALITMVAQLVGGIVGGVLVYLLYLPHWGETKDPGLKLAVFSTGPAIRNPMANLLTEVIATTFLIVGIFCIFSKQVGGIAPGVGPFMVAGLIYVLGSAMGGPTGYALNPARDLGPRIAHAILPIPGKGDSDWGYSWVPVVGPFLGGLVAYAVSKAVGIL